MALEAVVFQHSMAASSGNPWLYEQIEVGEGDKPAPDLQQNGPFLDSFHQRWDATNLDGWDAITTNRDGNGIGVPVESQTPTQVVGGGRRKRRRTKTCKNKEEVENQRMTHIAVERNRRKQMNEYLNVLRSLMPSSYVQRGDQASIVGGAINFVKELEQQLQSLEAQKRSIQQSTAASSSSNSSAQPFADFFTFPQYSTCTSSSSNATPSVDQTAADKNRSTRTKLPAMRMRMRHCKRLDLGGGIAMEGAVLVIAKAVDDEDEEVLVRKAFHGVFKCAAKELMKKPSYVLDMNSF